MVTGKAILDAQVALLGSMLIDEKCIGPVLSETDAADFSAEEYRTIYQTIRQLFTSGETVDPVTVLSALKSNRGTDWYDLLRQVMELTPTSANWGEYARVLRDEAQLLRAQNLGLELTQAPDLASAAEVVSRINGAMVERQSNKPLTMEEGLKLFYERRRRKVEYIPWGLPDLDAQLFAERGDYIIIAGAPSDGKTSLALATAYRQAEKYRVGFFSLETNKGKAMDRLVSTVARISMGDLKRNTVSDEGYQAVAELSSQILSRSLEIVKAASMTVGDIFAYALARRYEIIYIDHVQIIKGDSRRDRYTQITSISGEIHTLAQSTGIAAVVLSQLSRQEKNGKPRPPTIHDLRESGALEQDADVIMLLYRTNLKDRTDPHRILEVGKNKEGELGAIPLIFDGATQSFRKNYNYVPPKKKDEEYEQYSFKILPKDTETPFEGK